jgi:molybdate transport system ATP-binding protein
MSVESSGLFVRIEKILAGFSLAIQFSATREILVLFGPSGAGKTQTLNAIAGLTRPESGEITLDGVDFFRAGPSGKAINLPARERRVGYVFQHYALFPHLTALENVGYSFWRARDARRRAQSWLERMRLESLANRYPHELSGGQQQRVAIARALAAEPQVLLLDEPFSALDHSLRAQLHEELRLLQAAAGLIILYVTHSLDDALVVGDRLALVREGKIEQIGPTEEVITSPDSRTAAEILGLPNIIQARVIGRNSNGLELDWKGLRLPSGPAAVEVGSEMSAYLMPGGVIIHLDEQAGKNLLKGIIKRRQPSRRFTQVRIALSHGSEIEVSTRPTDNFAHLLEPGQQVWLEVPRECVRLIDERPI